MDVGQVLAANIASELTDGLEEGQRLNVANGAANFCDHHIGAAIRGYAMNPFADFSGDVRDHLYGAAVVGTTPLFVDHRLVDRTGGHAVEPRHGGVGKAFVVTQVKVCFGAVLGDKHLSMLEGAHRSWIHVQVWVQLQDRDVVATRLQQSAEAGGHNPLADA